MVIAGGHNDIRGGTKWIGENGWIWVNRAGKKDHGFEASNPEWQATLLAGRKKVEAAEEKMSFKLIASNNHFGQFLDCINRGRRRSRPSKWPIARRRPAIWATSPRWWAAS